MLTQVSVYHETIDSHLFAERAKRRYCVYARVVALLPLQAAHLRDERLGPADLHAVNHMCNSHSGCLASDSTALISLYFRHGSLRAADRSN
jgi:hypothetical protein